MLKNTIREAVYDLARGMHDSGAIPDDRMAAYEESRPAPESYDPSDIQRIRTRNGLTQSTLAFYLNVSLPTVHKWEQGKKKPSCPARKLLDLLGRKGLKVLY